LEDKTGKTLQIKSVSSENIGLYRCRASSKFAKKFSKIAYLQVKGSSTTVIIDNLNVFLH